MASERIRKRLAHEAHGLDPSIKISSSAGKVAGFMVDAFVRETVARAATAAQLDGVNKVGIQHLEKILPQLLLDFS
eukprot:748400-Hanusia_phi.AAC.7